MNLDLLWEHEKRRVAEGGAVPAVPASVDADDVEMAKKPKAAFKFKKVGSAASKLSVLDTQCIPHLSTDDNIFERNGYALDYEGHMNKRLNQPPVLSSTYHAAASPVPSSSITSSVPTTSHAAYRSPDDGNKKRLHAIDAPKKKPPAQLKGVPGAAPPAVAATSPLPTRHDKLSLNSLLKTAARSNQQLTYRRTELDPTTNAPPKAIEEHAIKAYMGDYFSTRGEYVDGMLYMSRMKKSHVLLNGSASAASPVQALDGVKLKETLASATAASDDADVGGLSSPGSSANPPTGGGAAVKSTQAQRCASTLANWSSNPANARVMVNEGVVQALMVLSRNDDVATRIHCVTTFMNLSNVSELRQGIIQLGAVKTLVAVLSGCDDRTLQTACALTLCNLCCLSGEEVTLVADSAVGALSALVVDAPGVAAISERALFNLTCVAEPYAQIDVVIKALVSLASSASSSSSSGGGGAGMGAAMSGIGNAVVRERTLHMCAMAFVNLSNMKRVRSRLMEEGIVPAISALLKSHSLDVKHWAVYVMCNIASMRSCRVELVTKGALNILVALAPHPTLPPKTLHVIGTILCHLSKEPSIRHRLVVEGLLSVVAAIGRAQGTGPTLVLTASDDIRRVCATAIHNCSCSDDTRVKLVERDGVAVLTALSTGCESADVRRMCTLALCNFLMVKQAAMEVVGCGAVTSLLDLAMQPDTPLNSQLLYATAFYNLCHNPISRDSIGTAGGVGAIAALCTANLPPPSAHSSLAFGVLTLCAASLCYLAADDNTRHFVATADVVHVITRMLQTSPTHATCVPIQRFGVACLSMLSQDQLCATWILDQGGIDAILATCANSRDGETKACCCDLLASLSYHTHCRQKLVSIGVLPSLTKLAKLRDPDIQRRCATAIGNLASEASVHDALLAANIVHVLSILSNSYSEESQSDCAKALCNLSTSPGFETKLVAEGAVGVLLMICAVRSGSLATKETCARALGNLLTPSTMDTMLHEGLAKLLPALTKGGDGPTSPVPATIFAKLLRHPHARDALCTESQALRTLFTYMSRDGHDAATIDLLSSIVCDLLVHANTRPRAVADGVVAAVADLARRTAWSNSRLVSAVLLLAASDDTRMDAVTEESVNTLLAYLEPSSGHDVASPVTWMVVTALCHLGWHDVSRSQLHDPSVVVALVTLVLPRLLTLLQDPTTDAPSATTVLNATLLTLTSLAFRPDHATTMLQNGLCAALVGVATLPGLSPPHRRLVCILLRQMSHADTFHALLQVRDSRQPVLALLCTLCLHPTEILDDVGALDCADALCNIAAIDCLAPKLVVEDFIGSIDALLTRSPSPDIQWRCTAALWMLSGDATCRKAMVDLHCTKTLVRVARSTAANNHTLHMCTLTLGNLSADPANAAQMVVEDAVAALLHLSTFDSDVTRDACSLALANLSHESPPVPSGSVLALIHLGMHGKSAAPLSTSNPTTGSAARPPHVTTPHHESSAAPPAYTYEEVDYTSVMAGKYAADVADRQPPIPHLPSITVDPDSLHASMDNPSGGGGGAMPSSHDQDDLLPSQQLVFSKIEPTDPTNLGAGGLDGGGSGLLDDVQEEHDVLGEDGAHLPPSSPDLKHGDDDDERSSHRGSTSGSNGSHDKSSRQLLHLTERRTTRGLLKKRSSVALLVANAPGSFRPKKSSDSEIHLNRMGSTASFKKRPSKVAGLGMSASVSGLPAPSSHGVGTSASQAALPTNTPTTTTTPAPPTSKKSVTIQAPLDVLDTPEQRADDLRHQARKMGLWS